MNCYGCRPGPLNLLRVLFTAGLLVGFCFANHAIAATITENFDSDPGWEVLNNTGLAGGFLTNFGFSNTNNLGAPSTAGEAGGTIDRRQPTVANGGKRWGSYADDISEGGFTGDSELQATGRYGWEEREGATTTSGDSGEWFVGWFQGGDGVTNARPTSGLFFRYNSRAHFLSYISNGGTPQNVAQLTAAASPPSLDGCVGTQSTSCPGAMGGKEFDLQYDPDGNAGGGVLSVTFTDSNSNTYSMTGNLPAGVKATLGTLDRFGILGIYDRPSTDTSALRATRVWIDDVTYDDGTIVPEPTSLLLLAMGAMSLLPHRARADSTCSRFYKMTDSDRTTVPDE